MKKKLLLVKNILSTRLPYCAVPENIHSPTEVFLAPLQKFQFSIIQPSPPLDFPLALLWEGMEIFCNCPYETKVAKIDSLYLIKLSD